MNKKIIIILFFCFIIILAWIIYYFIPRYNAGYLNNIGELEDKYPLCHITNFKSKGRLIFIEKRQWSSWTIVVFGKFDDDINIFKDDRRGRNIRIFMQRCYLIHRMISKLRTKFSLTGSTDIENEVELI